MIATDDSLWFVDDDNNFDTDNQLSSIVKNSADYLFAGDYKAMSSASSIPTISFSGKK